MNVELINDWWMTTDSGGQMGTTNNTGVTDKQKHNAEKIYRHFIQQGWTLNAISAMIGNMQLESWLSPALIQATNRWRLPNSAASLSDVPNNVMLTFYDGTYGLTHGGFGIGLAQWDGDTSTAPAGQKLVSFAMRYNLNWYDGDTQVFRIQREKETDIQWVKQTLGSTYWTWEEFVNSTDTPENLAWVWRICYEVADPDTDPTRQANARYWYDYLGGVSPYETPPVWLFYAFKRNKQLKNYRRYI